MLPRTSIVIVEHATAGPLVRCLRSLERLEAVPERWEVVVVDNASPTPIDDLPRQFPWVRFVRSSRNLGFAGACAAALAHLSGEVIVTLNPDAEVAPTWLGALLAPLADPSVGVVGCKIYYPGTRILQHAGGVVFANGRTEHRGRGEEDLGQYDRLEDVPYVTGAALAVRRTLVDQIGLFSPVYFPVYYEETELCLRARRHGWRVVYAPESVLWHEEAVASGGAADDRFLRRYHTSRIRFVLRNAGPGQFLRRFVPAELAYLLAPGRPATERRICLRAYLEAALSARARRTRAGEELLA